MVETKQIIRFALLAGVLVAVLLLPFGPFERGYASSFRSANNILFSRFWLWGDGRVSFIDLRDGDERDVVRRINGAVGFSMPPGFKPPKKTDSLDTLMVLEKRSARGALGVVRTSSRAMGWWPTAITIALLAASPGGWRRRLAGVMWGLFLVHVFIAVRLSIEIAYMGFARADKAYALFSPSEGMFGLLGRIEEVIVQDPTISFVAPVFIWLLICLLNGSLTTFRPAGEAATDDGQA